MTFHRITDLHIVQTGGSLRGFFKPIPFASLFKKIDWDVQWNFVFRKTIPFFWIPAQTITFLLPEGIQDLIRCISRYSPWSAACNCSLEEESRLREKTRVFRKGFIFSFSLPLD